jgi:titin
VLTLEFYDSQMDDNDTTALVIDMDRTDTTLAVDELGYTIDLPDGLVVADSAEGNLTCEGTVGADYGDTSVTVSGASIIAGNGNCRLIVSVTAEASGTYSITGADVTGLTGGLTNDVSTATLIVNPALPQLGARFEPSSINVLTTSTLWLELGRTDKSPTAVASGLGYTLSLPAGLVVGPGGVGSDCGGNATATPGGTSVVLSGGALLAGDRYCEVAVPVKATSSGEHALDYSSLISVTGVDENLAHGCLSSGGEIVAQGEGCLPTLTANKLAQTIMFTQPSDRSVTAGPVALTTSASSELTVGLSSTTPQVCTVSGATVTPIGPGTCSISANQAGNDIYEAAEELTRTFTITGASLSAQTITFSPPSSVALSDGTRTLSASASSGLTVTFVTSTPLVCTVSGSTLTLVTTGVCVIQAQQSGNGSYTAATPVTRSITVTSNPQTITFASLGNASLGQGSVTATATASSGLPVVLTSSTPTVCTVSGRTITLLAGGTCTIAADQSGDAQYSAATTVSRSFTVTVPPGVPSQVNATAGVSSITASWSAPSGPGQVTGYTAIASPGPATCSTTGATSCVMGGTAGVTYTVTVIATSADGESSPSGQSGPVTPTAPQPPAQPPVTDLTLTTDKGLITTAAPGQLIVFIGTGFAPYSTVTITVYSEPTVLGTVVTDGNGDFRKPITVPPDLAAGAHTAVAQGVAPDGTPRAMNLDITVAAAAPSEPAEPGDQLPVTGGNTATMVLAGMISVAAGFSLLLGARPRRRRPVPTGRLAS